LKTRRPAPSGGGTNVPNQRRSKPTSRPDQPRPGTGLLYGRNAVWEALRGRRKIRRLLLAEGIHEDTRIEAIIQQATSRGIPVARLPRNVFGEQLGSVNHQGIALDAGPYPYVPLDDVFSTPGTILALDHIQDPQNFGTLLRTAEAAGVVAVLIPADRAVGVTPAVVNASAGAVEHLRIAQIPNLPRALDLAKQAGWWVAGLATGETAQNLFTISDLPTPLALVIGGEGSGITPNVRKRCDLLLSLPMAGEVASLNAATAGAIALYELFRRQHHTPIE
jgi:23S rRNA (guanosine2251-2'-O)-methyltransferase